MASSTVHHWKTQTVAGSVETLSGRRKKDYAVESAAEALEAQGEALGGALDADADEEAREREAVAVA